MKLVYLLVRKLKHIHVTTIKLRHCFTLQLVIKRSLALCCLLKRRVLFFQIITLFFQIFFCFFVYQEGNLAITHLDFLLLNNLKSTVQMDVLAICSGMERNGVSKMTTSNREVRIDQIFGTNFLPFFPLQGR